MHKRKENCNESQFRQEKGIRKTLGSLRTETEEKRIRTEMMNSTLCLMCRVCIPNTEYRAE
jgi:hypothetical protein